MVRVIIAGFVQKEEQFVVNEGKIDVNGKFGISLDNKISGIYIIDQKTGPN